MSFKRGILPILSLALIGCTTTKDSFENRLSKTLKEKPEILTQIIEQNPEQFISAFQKAVRATQEKLAERRELEARQKIKHNLENLLRPLIRPDEAIRGKKDAPLVLVEYLDFECPFCKRGSKIVDSLRERFGQKIQVIYKHMPLESHKNALITAQYYEALRLQSPKLAFQFHDQVFQNQSRLRKGTQVLKEISSRLGVNLKQLEQDLHSKEVRDRIEQDRLEARKFGIQGAPGFLINGVLVQGAYPEEHFVQIINELQKHDIVKL